MLDEEFSEELSEELNEVEEEWNNGQDSSLTELESSSDSSELLPEESSEQSSLMQYSEVPAQSYSIGHFGSYEDFLTVGFQGVLLGFALSMVLALVTLAFNAMLNIIKKGGN